MSVILQAVIINLLKYIEIENEFSSVKENLEHTQNFNAERKYISEW